MAASVARHTGQVNSAVTPRGRGSYCDLQLMEVGMLQGRPGRAGAPEGAVSRLPAFSYFANAHRHIVDLRKHC